MPSIVIDATEIKQQQAKKNAKNIPDWATWDEDETLAWIDANVTDLASAIGVLKKMARMQIALRDNAWPNLGD